MNATDKKIIDFCRNALAGAGGKFASWIHTVKTPAPKKPRNPGPPRAWPAPPRKRTVKNMNGDISLSELKELIDIADYNAAKRRPVSPPPAPRSRKAK